MTRRRLPRRDFLRGLGGVAFGLPLVGTLSGRALADEVAPPKRLLVFFTPCGTQKPFRMSKNHPTDFAFGASLGALTAHRSDLVVVDGLRLSTSELGPGDAHQKGAGQTLTTTPLLEGSLFYPFDDLGNLTVGWGGGTSVDQEVAKHVGSSTWLRSLVAGVQTRYWSAVRVDEVVSYLGPNQPVPPDNDPLRVYKRLFGPTQLGAASLEQLRNQRLSVLDAVKADFDELVPKLDAEARAKVEAHADLVRDIEKRLDQGFGAFEGCDAPKPPTLTDPLNPDLYAAVGGIQTDLIVSAFACDLVRVATLQWSYGGSNQPFEQLGVVGEHHVLTHAEQTESVVGDLVQIEAFYAARFADLISKLKSVPEGDGTLLDNTLVLWVNEMSEPESHTFLDMPTILAGGSWAFPNGRQVDASMREQNDLHISVLHAMGIPATTFGHPDFATGPLSQLTG